MKRSTRLGRLLFPNGQTLNLAGMPLVDLSGYTGMHDQVNQHLFRLFGSAVLLSAISGGDVVVEREQGSQHALRVLDLRIVPHVLTQ